jgi:hypothetical protein
MVPIDGNVNVLVSANYMRNPNSRQRDRGINYQAGHTQEQLFPPGQVHTQTSCTRRTDERFNMMALAFLAIIKQVAPG